MELVGLELYLQNLALFLDILIFYALSAMLLIEDRQGYASIGCCSEYGNAYYISAM
jgi:hypothetical protein